MSATDASDAELSHAPEGRHDAEVHEALTLDRMVHEPARLAILAVLSGAEEVDFPYFGDHDTGGRHMAIEHVTIHAKAHNGKLLTHCFLSFLIWGIF